ncbi:molybdate transport system regulatory protein [Sphingomonas naasensis]|uniref:LysR family transcriptional regulator n=1 Tax=Sphingomonas naasensis TaxID=1344951 RepID=A0A4S1WPG1_9SPHN|nr:LysR family transcriptional regulator [Sphingomonas naasensis]NIJ20299.1 molybdate transport system regulatory protein [Sphingomonas naasensis]TGX44425.1 LysR family transcriptional regulator [Sphingomonas naasensis]
MLIGPLKLKAQIYCGDEIAMGPGKADLLEAIRREGSISRAGKAMGMSYRRTWLLVDAMNRCWAEKLVETVPGGASNRGARLTGCGEEVLRLYRGIERNLDEAVTGAPLAQLTALLRPEPAHSATPQADCGSA